MGNMAHEFVNVELINKTISSIRSGRLDMGDWDYCICGHIRKVQGQVTVHGSFYDYGANQLNISKIAAENLFCNWSVTDGVNTKANTIRALEILRDEGKVDWRRAYAEV